MSIKRLTLLGFSLVALPLICALLYSAYQVNQLSKQGANAIFTVAELINTNQNINATLKKMERYASQYLVLQDKELIENYLLQQQILIEAVNDLSQHKDAQIALLTTELSQAINQTHQRIIITSNSQEETISLTKLQKHFKQLSVTNEQIDARSRELINHQAETIRNATDQISFTLLKSLLIIPLSFLIAIFFSRLIANPLKRLIVKIQLLQQGNFQQATTYKQRPVAGFIEITEINEALDTMRARLHALELQKSSFIRHISHELKTPLAAIREGTELIYDNSVGSLNTEQQEITKIIRSSTTRLQRLIEELLDFNIVLDSTSLQDKETINLSQLIEQVLLDRTLEIKRKSLIIEKQYSDIMIQSNTKQLAVIIDNLLSNAIKYSPEKGVISLEAQLVDHQLNFSISDQGEGITKEQQDKVFDAFYQGTPPKDYNIKSSGLGLTIVKELLMRLNGSIRLNSQTHSPSGTQLLVTLNHVFIRED